MTKATAPFGRALCLLALTCGLSLFADPAARAQPALSMVSPPEQLARRAIGDLPGSAVVGVWRGVAGVGAAHCAGLRATWPQAELKPFAGRYLQTGLDFDVQVTAGQLTAKLNDQPRFAVLPVPGQADRFACDVVKAELQFERDAGGQVQALVLHQNGHQRVPKIK